MKKKKNYQYYLVIVGIIIFIAILTILFSLKYYLYFLYLIYLVVFVLYSIFALDHLRRYSYAGDASQAAIIMYIVLTGGIIFLSFISVYLIGGGSA